MQTLTELNRQLLSLEEDRKAIALKYKNDVSDIEGKQRRIKEQIVYAKSSVDGDKIKLGLILLRLEFPTNGRDGSKHMICDDLIRDAKKDLVGGCEKLRHSYFGQKCYEGFDQREDHAYGYGPRHGSIYQSIGLRSPSVRLSDEEIEACLYVLENLNIVLEAINKKTNRLF